MSQIDPKTIDRIKKLLNLARDGGATEAEANLAMERATEIMMENNLSMATVEASGQSSQEARLKEGAANANYRWQRMLMKAIADASFLDVTVTFTRVANRFGYRDLATGYELIGRVSNVTMAKQMYEYLLSTIARLRKEYATDRNHKEAVLFAEGLADRLAQRINERHSSALRAQREKAEEENKKRREEAARWSSTSKAMTIIMEDFAQDERDANADVKNGWPIGTTKAKREDRERRNAEYNRRMEELQAEGLSWDAAWYVAQAKMTKEAAIARANKEKQEREARRREEEVNPSKQKKERTYRYRKTREDRLNDRDYARSLSESYRAGSAAGDKVSLDQQVGKRGDAKRLA